MGDMFRSEKMVLAQLFIQPEAAYSVISAMGETGCAQFRDLNEEVNAFQRKFVNEVRLCDEMERKLTYIETEVTKNDINIPDVVEIPNAPNSREMSDLEIYLEKTEGDIRELSNNAVHLKSCFLEANELKHVLEKAQVFFNDRHQGIAVDSDAQNDDPRIVSSSRGQLGFVAGVVNRERLPAFERMLWRITRENTFFIHSGIEEPLEDPVTGHQMLRDVFVAFSQGEELKSRVKKVCVGFHASIYECPSSTEERQEMLKEVKMRIEDLTIVLNQTKDYRSRVFINVAKELQNWKIMVSKMKAIYHTLNFFNYDVTNNKCLIGECWIPNKDIYLVEKALADSSSSSGSSIPSFLNIIGTNETPPTFNRTNKFTRGFQNLIDAYGVASYEEANPALYTIITFPFLFAVMFGDIGHAIIMTAFGLWLILAEKKIAAQKNKSEIFSIFFGGRYIILLMGIFSMYTGFIYNDIFSKSLNIFGSKWSPHYNQSTFENSEIQIEFHPGERYEGTPYFIGVDPVWQMAKNKIIFLNTYKMKLSIIFGVAHMIFGVVVSTFNYVHFRKYSSIFLEFLPQVLLLCFLFLYMVIMIFIKWIKYSAFNGDDISTGTACAPSVLIYFINMMLFKANDHKSGCETYMFDAQGVLQQVLVFASLICIPAMLFGKPLFIMLTRKKSNTYAHMHEGNSSMDLEQSPQPVAKVHGEEEEEPMSEIFIHQIIHTIEYVLSTISHTASYLRLWALSLAHAQLSEVLWSMIFHMGLTMGGEYVGGAFIFLFFTVWATFTIAILVLMEGLSAFLHTLRLHWVEFMSKFYTGLGYQFQPFSFKLILEEEEATED